MPVGRPSLYTPELISTICERIAGGESLRAICVDDDMPDRLTFNRWLGEHDELVAKYAHAREEQAEFHHAEMDRLERDTESGTLPPQAANVILTNKRWRMEKLKPKVYGVKQQLEVTGSLQSQSDEQLAERIALMQARIDGQQ